MNEENRKISLNELGEKLDTLAEAVTELQNINENITVGREELLTGDGVEEVIVPNVPQGVSTKTVVSVIVSIIVFLNMIFSIVAPNLNIDIGDEVIYTGASLIVLAINFGYAMWKDHNFTSRARRRKEVADQVIPKKAK